MLEGGATIIENLFAYLDVLFLLLVIPCTAFHCLDELEHIETSSGFGLFPFRARVNDYVSAGLEQ